MTYQRLKLNRFIAIKENQIMYDEHFHDGINVIRGEHSVGKSTLLDLIFYSLGGELKEKEWKEPIEQYEKVICEASIGERKITLTRAVATDNTKPHIEVIEGSYEDSLSSISEPLELGPVRSENKMSFSEFMFEALGWGQSITSENNNLTMHQVLRLLYLSQSSDSTKIFRNEVDARFDKESTRKAIGDFILGLDDLSLYKNRQKKWKLDKKVDSINSDIKSYRKILKIDKDATMEFIDSKIKSKHEELKNCLIEKASKLKESSGTIPDDFSKRIFNISSNIANLTKNIKHLLEKETYINSEITDCILFGKSLDFRIKSLNESKDTFLALGEINFTYCPSCFSAIKEQNNNSDSCKCALCKNDIPRHSLEEKYTETLSELKYQQRQNSKTVARLEDESLSIKNSLDIMNKELRESEYKLRNTSTSSNEREVIIEEYAKRTSKIESEIDELMSSKTTFIKIDELEKDVELKNEELTKIQKLIKQMENESKERRFNVLSSISSLAKKLLESDLGNEHKFNDATSLSDEINFGKDEWSIGGRVTFSDSSNVVKKSSLQMSILKGSILDEYCRLPNFMILDFECGDLNAPRSHRLQHNLMKTFKDINDFQVIITSSKVCDELNNDMYGVGKYYEPNDYIFK
ncbi:SMC family protein [Photobacterium alginatilyticum]|uniref:Rad50/SbcC-type AAA domain-containing protein n=1 Tax=Photobacterium alginatilyticum TaxID=1775171 RepID=A0ABW9YUB4_9GAMM|nr:hypothetical protein [Photobacterium alginatilyticum]NBI56104.1 hypothetical protein [Photobacterium alginatilyticum]